MTNREKRHGAFVHIFGTYLGVWALWTWHLGHPGRDTALRAAAVGAGRLIK